MPGNSGVIAIFADPVIWTPPYQIPSFSKFPTFDGFSDGRNYPITIST